MCTAQYAYCSLNNFGSTSKFMKFTPTKYVHYTVLGLHWSIWHYTYMYMYIPIYTYILRITLIFVFNVCMYMYGPLRLLAIVLLCDVDLQSVMTKLFQKVFPYLLRLACDIEKV